MSQGPVIIDRAISAPRSQAPLASSEGVPGVDFRRRSWHAHEALDAIAIRFLDLLFAITAVISAGMLFVISGFIVPRGRLRTGKHGRRFLEYSWRTARGRRGRVLRALHLDGLPRAWNVLCGDMALVGPRPGGRNSLPVMRRRSRRVREVRPGVLSLYGLRRRANIDFHDEVATDLEFVETYSARSNLGLLARYALALFYGKPEAAARDQVRLLGIRIDNLRMDQAIAQICERALGHAGAPAQVTFINAHCANVSFEHPGYRKAVAGSALVLADGIGMKIAGKILRLPITQNVNGTDMFPPLCAALGQAGVSVYLLGGGEGVAAEVAGWIRKHHPETKVAGLHGGFFDSGDEAQVVNEIRASGAGVLFVAMGVPLQELWIARNLKACGVAVAVGVGGLFDFYSARLPRAPQWLRELGLEWIYRLLQEPRRLWRRYVIGNVKFLFRVMRERIAPAPPIEEER